MARREEFVAEGVKKFGGGGAVGTVAPSQDDRDIVAWAPTLTRWRG
jgi:hypothetical protein